MMPGVKLNRAASSAYRTLRKNTLFQKIVGNRGRPLTPDKWIFVVGCYNSGTTLLSRLMQYHPECSGTTNEGVVLTTELKRPEDFGWPRMWIFCLNELRIAPDSPASIESAERIKRQWSFSFDADKSAIVEKSISNGARIPFLANNFKPAYFVHIVRDGIAVAEGIRRKSTPQKYQNPKFDNKYPLELCIKQWLVANGIIERDLQTLAVGQRCVVKYEDLCADPVSVMAQIYQFCGLENGKNIDFHTDSVIRNMNSRSYRALTSDELEMVKHVGFEGLKKWGYADQI
jgi:hypothetical protein